MALTAKKVLKKFWFPIVAPKMFDSVKIGESYVAEPAVLKGKTVTIGLDQVVNDQRLRNISAKFKVIEVNERAMTDIIGMELSPTFVKRMVKPNKDRVDQSFLAKTSDGKIVRIKPFMVTTNATKGSALSSLRRSSEQKIKQFLGKMKYDTLIMQLVTNNFQRVMKQELAKIYPLKTYEIRIIRHVKNEEPIGEEDLTLFKERSQPRAPRPRHGERQEATVQKQEAEVIDQAAEVKAEE